MTFLRYNMQHIDVSFGNRDRAHGTDPAKSVPHHSL